MEIVGSAGAGVRDDQAEHGHLSRGEPLTDIGPTIEPDSTRSMGSIYKPLDSSKKQIRVLDLHPGVGNDRQY